MLTRDDRGAVLGGVALTRALAEAGVSTPAYVYDLDGMEADARELDAGFGDTPHLIAYALKACSAGPVVRCLARAGCGADVVSGSELALALGAGVPADRVVMSGVAKQAHEIDAAITAGDRGIFALQIESVEEIARVEARARALGRVARVGLRINPGVEADTHSHVATGHDEAKFGIARVDLERAAEALARATNVELVGLGGHVGSQLMDTGAYLEAARVILALSEAWRASGRALRMIDFGGGFGVDYGKSASPPARPRDFARAAVDLVAGSAMRGVEIVVEPGRSLVAAHGVLCASVIGVKRSTDRRWLLVDAGMNDLLRPALYAAHHRIEPLERAMPGASAEAFRVVGPVCESSDDFGSHPFDVIPERVVIRDAGAYGYTMASQYNGRAMPAEVFLRKGRVEAVSRPANADAWVRDRLSIVEHPEGGLPEPLRTSGF